MVQAPPLDGLSFDPFSFQKDGVAPAEIDIGGREVAQALVVTAVIVVLDESLDLSFEVARKIVVLQQDPVLQGLMPSFDLALGLGVIGRTTDVLHVSIIEPFRQLARDITRPIIGQQPRLVDDRCLIAA